MRPYFSEFSYGFALTRELCDTNWGGLRAAPVFPSLIEEGKTGGGYDVHLDLPGNPLFLQFKTSQRMERTSAGEWHLFGKAYSRFWIHPSRHSKQHRLLLDLDTPPNCVLYAAPAIHRAEELNKAFLVRDVTGKSVFFRPQEIGPMPDPERHCVAFQPGASSGFRCSEPEVVPIFASGRQVFEELVSVFGGFDRALESTGFCLELANRLSKSFGSIGEGRPLDPDEGVAVRAEASYLTRTLLGAELLWVAESPESDLDAEYEPHAQDRAH